MVQINPFVTRADEYDRWFDLHGAIFSEQISLIRPFVIRSGPKLEVGCGSGRFTASLGIPWGIDLSLPLCTMSYQRGISVIRGDASDLPIKNNIFIQVFLITVLELVKDPERVLKEIHRSLLPEGSLIVVLLDTESETGKNYRKRSESSTFLSQARFFRNPEMVSLIESAGYEIRTIRRSAGLFLISSVKRRE
jgi:ubiquinone/menaquinone biosynthesis C-methylase UbiE